MAKFSTRLFLAVVVVLLACKPVSTQSSGDYVIGPQDVLVITVFHEPDLDGNYAVELDGTFTFPFIGRVKAGDLTLRQFEDELKTLLADGFLKKPQVTVAVQQYRSQRIFVVGEVNQPGAYPLTGDMTLIEALAIAGSATIGASNEAIVVRPKEGRESSGPIMPGADPAGNEDDDDVVKITVDLHALQSGQLSQNVQLRDGDTIFVPRAETIYLVRHVNRAGAYPIAREITVLQALALAGGVSQFGSTGRIEIVRIVDGKELRIKAALTDPVRPGDTIIVPERYF